MKKQVIITVVFFVLLASVFGVCILLLSLFSPGLEDMYADFGAELPVISRVLFLVGDFFRQYWIFVIPIFVLFDIVISVIAGLLLRNVSKKVLIIASIMVFTVIALGVCCISASVFLPTFSLANSLK